MARNSANPSGRLAPDDYCSKTFGRYANKLFGCWVLSLNLCFKF
jgi:hypothetical protein